MTERDDARVEEEAALAAAEARSIGRPAPDEEDPDRRPVGEGGGSEPVVAAEGGWIGDRRPDKQDPARRPVQGADGAETGVADLVEAELRDQMEGVERSQPPHAHAEGEPDTFDEPA